MQRKVIWVAYDIASNKRRRQVERLLLEHGHRLQYSLFEIVISRTLWLSLRQELVNAIDCDTDYLNYYTICHWCRLRVLQQGRATLPEKEAHRCIC